MKLYFLFFLLFILPFSYSMYGGESLKVLNINNCYDKVQINVSGYTNIDIGEYSFNNCTENLTNYWLCDCNGYFDIVLNTLPNTINNYSIEIKYINYYIEEEVIINTGSSGGGYFIPNYNYTKPKNITKPVIKTYGALNVINKSETLIVDFNNYNSIIDNKDVQIIYNNTINENLEKPFIINKNIIIAIILILIILLIIIVIIISKINKFK